MKFFNQYCCRIFGLFVESNGLLSPFVTRRGRRNGRNFCGGRSVRFPIRWFIITRFDKLPKSSPIISSWVPLKSMTTYRNMLEGFTIFWILCPPGRSWIFLFSLDDGLVFLMFLSSLFKWTFARSERICDCSIKSFFHLLSDSILVCLSIKFEMRLSTWEWVARSCLQ